MASGLKMVIMVHRIVINLTTQQIPGGFILATWYLLVGKFVDVVVFLDVFFFFCGGGGENVKGG